MAKDMETEPTRETIMAKPDFAEIAEQVIEINYESEEDDPDTDVLQALLDSRALDSDAVRTMLRAAAQAGYDQAFIDKE